MDGNRAETIQNQSDGQTSDTTTGFASDPVNYDDGENTDDMPGAVTNSFNKGAASSSESVEIIGQNLQHVGGSYQTRSGVEFHPETTVGAEEPASQPETDFADFQNLPSTDYVVNDSAETSQSQTSVQDQWRPSNPFLGIAGGNDTETDESVTPTKSVIPTDHLPMSTSLPSDMLAGYSKPRDSGPSSLCSASPYESPTHVASGCVAPDQTTDAAGNRPDSLYFSRSILQERERQWLAKKGSYSSLSECDSSPAGSVEALIEAATSTPLRDQGTISMEGDMITFVADGINELIKRSRGGLCSHFTYKYLFL